MHSIWDTPIINIFIVASILTIVILATGCAGTSFTDAPEDDDDGIRYYARKLPCVLIYSDGKGGLVAEQVSVTDTTNMRAADPYAILAANDATFKFKDGVLTEQVSDVDTTILPLAVLEAIKSVAGLAADALLDQQGDTGFPVVSMPPPALYCVDKFTTSSPKQFNFVGGYPDGAQENVRINVTVNPKAKLSSNASKEKAKPSPKPSGTAGKKGD